MSKKHPNSLGRKEKLKSRKQIDLLFTTRTFLTQPPIRMFYHIGKKADIAKIDTPTSLTENATASDNTAVGSTETALKAGFSASKRYFKHASKRNRVKRLMREVYRKHKQPLLDVAEHHGYLISLFFLYGSKELPTYEQIEEKLCPLLQKLEKQLGTS